VIKDDIGSLPADQNELETRWPRLLAGIMSEIRSPADPADLTATIGRDDRFMALVRGWDNMPTTAQANAWNMIQDRLWEAARQTRPFCVRCGECCRRGSPVLYDQDRPTLAAGAVKRQDLVTLRQGERAFSNREQKIVVVEKEQVKLKEAPDGRTCIFLGPGKDACLIYPDRPFQCRIMDCWDPSRFQTLLSLDPLTRTDLLGQNNPLIPVIEEHDRRCGLETLEAALKETGEQKPADPDKAMDAVLFDLHVRRFVEEKFGVEPEEMDFLFGRPLALIIQGFGFALDQDQDGKPRLTRLKPPKPSRKP